MRKWEYLMLTVVRDEGDDGGIVKCLNGEAMKNWLRRNWRFPDALTYCGERGWELVSSMRRQQGRAADNTFDSLYVFKRPQ